MKFLWSILAIGAVALFAFRSQTVTGTNKAADEMKQYWMVFLLKGPDRSHDSTTAARIQAAHMRNINRLATEGKIVMAGPMGYNKDLRGIFIMDAKDSTEAAQLVQTDSAIITGRLRFEVHPWWTAKGTYTFR